MDPQGTSVQVAPLIPQGKTEELRKLKAGGKAMQYTKPTQHVTTGNSSKAQRVQKRMFILSRARKKIPTETSEEEETGRVGGRKRGSIQ